MNSDYRDIRSRIGEEPTWYDLHGVPRFGEIPVGVGLFIRRVRCQDCHRVFLVCLVDEVYRHFMGSMVLRTVKRDESGEPIKCVSCSEYQYEYADASLHHYGGNFALPDGTTERREEEWLPIPDGWHYGDPPAHGCVGDTMNSIPEYEWGRDP